MYINPIKIGHTTMDVRKRLSKLQADNHVNLMLLAIEDGDKTRENEIHRAFVDCRLHGEWFSPNPHLIEYIASITPKPSGPDYTACTTKFSKYMADAGLSDSKLAELIGRSRTTVNRIRRGVVRPDWDTLALIQEVSHGEVTPADFL